MLNQIIMMLGAHYIADFPLQGSYLADNKGKRWYILMAHAFIYATTIAIALMFLGKYSEWKWFVIFGVHFLTDKWKSSQPKDEAHWHYIYYDQGIHILANLLMLL
jgi:hypothetical protein